MAVFLILSHSYRVLVKPKLTLFSSVTQVTWLASWTENIQNQIKYVMLNPSSRLKGEKDMEKYEKARRLKDKIVKIREDYSSGKHQPG